MFSFLFGSTPTSEADPTSSASESSETQIQRLDDNPSATLNNNLKEPEHPVLQISAASLRRRDSERDGEELVDNLLTQFPPYGTQKSLGTSHNNAVMGADLAIFSPLAWALGFDRDDFEEEDAEVHRSKEGDEEKLEGEDEFYSSGLKYLQEKRNRTISAQREGQIQRPEWAEDEMSLWYNPSYRLSQPYAEIGQGDTVQPEIDIGISRLTSRDGVESNLVSGTTLSPSSIMHQVRTVTRHWIEEPIDSIYAGSSSSKLTKESSLPMSTHENKLREIQCAEEFLDEDDVFSVDSIGDQLRKSGNNSSIFPMMKYSPTPLSLTQLRKACFACEAEFTTLRRRHFCSCCGNIFCSRCCSFILCPSALATTTEMNEMHQDEAYMTGSVIRTGCKECHDKASSSTVPVVISSDTDKSSNNTLEQAPPALNENDNNDTTKAPAPIIHDLHPSTSESTHVNEESNNSYQKLENENAASDNNTNIPHEVRDNIASRRFGKLAELGARSWQLGSVGFDDDEIKLIGTGVSVNVNSSNSILNDHANDESNHDDKMESHRPLENAEMQLHQASAEHLERLGRELLTTYAPLLIDNNEGAVQLWCDQIIKLATRTCSTVKPNVRGGDLLDIRPYCKVKG